MKKMILLIAVLIQAPFTFSQTGTPAVNPNQPSVVDSTHKGTDSVLVRKKRSGVSGTDNMPAAKPDTTGKNIPVITPSGKDRMPVMEMSDTTKK